MPLARMTPATSWLETFSSMSPVIRSSLLASALIVTSTVAVPGPSTGLRSSLAPRTAIESPSQFRVSWKALTVTPSSPRPTGPSPPPRSERRTVISSRGTP